MSELPVHRLAGIAVRCVDRLVRDDAFLLQAEVHEQAISHRLASYLQEELPDDKVDAEYNRHGLKVKTAQLPSGVKLVLPDVIVHSRGDDSANLLVIEVKIRNRGDSEDRLHAHQKLDSLVNGGVFHYELGLFVEFGYDSPHGAAVDELRWYVPSNTHIG